MRGIRLRADGLSIEDAHALARRDVEVVFGGQLFLDAPGTDGRATTSPRMHGGSRATELLEGQLRARGFGVLRLNGPDGWCLVVDLAACPNAASPEARAALATRCARIEEIMQSRRPPLGAPSDHAAEAAARERDYCMGQTITTLEARLHASQWVLDTHYGDGSDEARADRRAMTEALAAHAAAITRQVAAREMVHRDRYRYSSEIEGLARDASRAERRACEGLDLDRLRARARRAGVRAPEPPVVRAAAILFLLATSRGLELAALAMVGDQHAEERGRLLRRAAEARAAYATTHDARPPEARWIARARHRATGWLSSAAGVESPAEHATADGERTACGMPVATLVRIPDDHGRTPCTICAELLACGGCS